MLLIISLFLLSFFSFCFFFFFFCSFAQALTVALLRSLPRGADLRGYVKQRCSQLLEQRFPSAAIRGENPQDQVVSAEGIAMISKLYAPGTPQYTQILEAPSFLSLYGAVRSSSSSCHVEFGEAGALSLMDSTEESPSVLHSSSSSKFTATAPDWERRCHHAEIELDALQKRHFCTLLGSRRAAPHCPFSLSFPPGLCPTCFLLSTFFTGAENDKTKDLQLVARRKRERPFKVPSVVEVSRSADDLFGGDCKYLQTGWPILMLLL